MVVIGFSVDLSGTCFLTLLNSLSRLGIIWGLFKVGATAPFGDNQDVLGCYSTKVQELVQGCADEDGVLWASFSELSSMSESL